MSVLAFAALFLVQPTVRRPPPIVFTTEETAAFRDQAKRECGYASPHDLVGLSNGEREKILPCLIRTTVNRSKPLLPKQIEPGATIVSVSDFEGLPIFVLRFGANHPRGSAPKNQPSNYDNLLSTRTCNDEWLGGLIDAGMVDGVQRGAIVVYKLENAKSENLAMIAVAECHDAK